MQLEKHTNSHLAIDEHFKQSTQEKANDIINVIERLFDKNGLKQKSVLNKKQIRALIRAQVYSDRFGSKILPEVIEWFLEYSIADKNGRGRTDLVSIVNTV